MTSPIRRPIPQTMLIVAALCLAAACRSAAPPEGPNERVYRSEALAETGISAKGWRFLPLEPGGRSSQREFDRTVAGCTAKESEAKAIEFCLTQRGFYPTICDDGQDNDGDGQIDHPDDPGCAKPSSITESPACDDGRDNDGDGLVDFDGGGIAHEDPDCEEGWHPSEGRPKRR